MFTIQPIDKTGKLANGTVEKNLPQDDKFLDIAFKTEEKTEDKNKEQHFTKLNEKAPQPGMMFFCAFAFEENVKCRAVGNE